jgi:AraC-like DNA-binding protein
VNGSAITTPNRCAWKRWPRSHVDGLDAASAAFEVGYESASKFNREYNRCFGQPPMRDVRALRLAGSSEGG